MEVILHPLRMRILQTLLNGDHLTAQEMMKILDDVAVPTLYRHLNILVEHGIIEIVQENQVRGMVEKVYALPSKHLFSKEDIKKAKPEEHMDYFTMFMTNLLSQFNQYITHEHSDISVDKVSYGQIQLQLSDQEIVDMFKIISDAMMRNLDNKPNDDRKLYSISTILIPLLNKDND